MEEKIIDGVNVAGCRRRIGKNSYCRYFKRPCADNNFNCIWKQKARLEQENEELKARLRPLEDSYFNGLSSIEIAGLAKKSIRITSYNRQLEHALEEIKGTIKHFKTYFSEKELNKVKFSDITVIEEIIAEAIGEE